MVKLKSILIITIILAILFSGCIEEKKVEPSQTPTPVSEAVTSTATSSVTPFPEVTPTGNRILVRLDSSRGFIPGTQMIKTGDAIVWDNYDTETVTLISNEGLFGPEVLEYGQQYTLVFKKPGTYNFYLDNKSDLNGTIIVEAVSAIPTSTPVDAIKTLPNGTLFVTAQMLTPAYWSYGNYSLDSLRVKIYNQRNIPLSITARIMSGEQVLEERSFTLERDGSSYEFVNEKRHYISNTNVTLRLLIPGYQPAEYSFMGVDSLN